MCRCLRLGVCVFVLVWSWMKVFKTMSALSRYIVRTCTWLYFYVV